MDTPLVKRAYNLGLKAVPNFIALSEAQIAYYETHLDELKEAIQRGFLIPVAAPAPKFALLADLGIITVPADYDHATRLAKFKVRHQEGKKKSFTFYNNAITDDNFAIPSRILFPGDKLRVRAFMQTDYGRTTSEERMAYLVSQKMDVYTGAQGASLVFDQKRKKLLRNKWYSSFDEAVRLPLVDGTRGTPRLCVKANGDFSFLLGHLERPWQVEEVFLGFCDA